MQRKVHRQFDEEKLLRFAKSYLSEAFPNPRRLDCPPDTELIGLAEHPGQADPFVPPTPHLLFPMLQSVHGNPRRPEASESRVAPHHESQFLG
jgi:hypothetical protein